MSNEDDCALLRLDPDVLAALEVTGPYWPIQANEVVRQVFVSNLRSNEFEISAFVQPQPPGEQQR